MNACAGQSDLQHWILKLRGLPPASGDSIALFFERSFQHTRYPQHAWFGVHSSTVSLVVGGIWLAAVMRSGHNCNCHAMIHRHSPPLSIEEIKALLDDHTQCLR